MGGLNAEPAALGHGVPGVHDQVHDDLLDLARVGSHESQRRVQRRDQADVFAESSVDESLEVFEAERLVKDQAMGRLRKARDQGLVINHENQGPAGFSSGHMMDGQSPASSEQRDASGGPS